MRFNPPHYKESNAPEEAEFWVQEIEQLFSQLECPNREREWCWLPMCFREPQEIGGDL